MSSRAAPPNGLDLGALPLETARRLVAADFCTGLRTARAAYELSRAILVVRLHRREPQHRGIVRLHFHPAGVPAFAENAVDTRQVVAGHIEQEMMLKMIVHVIRRDEQALEDIRARGTRIAQRIGAIGN